MNRRIKVLQTSPLATWVRRLKSPGLDARDRGLAKDAIQALIPDTLTPAFWSGRRDSNSRPQPWQGCALPAELRPQIVCNYKGFNLTGMV